MRCSDLLGAADDDRAAAAMFYYGYLAAKAGIRVIDVSQIDGNIKKVMDRCAAAPNRLSRRPSARRSAGDRSVDCVMTWTTCRKLPSKPVAPGE